MDVVDCLTSISPGIDNSAVSLRKPLVACDLRCCPLQMPQQLFVVLFGVSDRGDVLARDDEDVHWRLGLDVGECVATLVLVNGLRRNASINDLAEEATHGEESTGVWFALSEIERRSPTESKLSSGVVPGVEETVYCLGELAVEGSNGCKRDFDEAVSA